MNKEMLAKVHPKFKNERQCRNPRCGGYFLSEEPQDYCPACREHGVGEKTGGKEINPENVLHTEINIEALSKKVAELEKQLAEAKIPKKKFNPKKCANCKKSFRPIAPNQSLCNSCREALTK